MKRGPHSKKKFTKVILATILLVFSGAAAVHFYYVYHYFPRTWPFTPHLPPLKKYPLTASDLAFGQKQVDRMMHDRPTMSQLVKKGDVIYNWTVRQFAGESIGHRILWMPTFPPKIPLLANAYNYGPDDSSYGYIFIRDKYPTGRRKGKSIYSEELWAYVVFESFNITNWRGFSSVNAAAFSRKISKDDYISQIAQLEFLASKRVSQFYEEVWRPWAAKSGATARPYLWFMKEPNSFEEWIKRFTDPTGYPYIYVAYYDFYRKDHIVFTMYVAPNYAQIHVRTLDGEGRFLTNQPCYNDYARTSPDRKKIVFVSKRSGKECIYLMNSDGSDVTKLPPVKATQPTFSPDGKTIVYAAKQSGNHEIYSMNSDGTNQVRLTHTTPEFDNVLPSVSPDAQKIAFASFREIKHPKQKKTSYLSDIYLMNRDGTNLMRLTSDAEVAYQPCFSPDGRRIAFVSYRNKNNDLYIMNVNGTGIVRLTDNPAQDEQPCFSPDGKSLAFSSNRLDGKKYQLFKLDIATKKATLLFKTKYHAQYPDWR